MAAINKSEQRPLRIGVRENDIRPDFVTAAQHYASCSAIVNHDALYGSARSYLGTVELRTLSQGRRDPSDTTTYKTVEPK